MYHEAMLNMVRISIDLVYFTLFLSYDYLFYFKGNLLEYSFLISFSAFLMILLVMSFDFISLFLLIEALSLTLFILIALNYKIKRGQI